MSASTLTTARASVGDDEEFIVRALHRHYGEREHEAAADALTTAQSMPFPDEHDSEAVADLIVATLNQWELDNAENEEVTA